MDLFHLHGLHYPWWCRSICHYFYWINRDDGLYVRVLLSYLLKCSTTVDQTQQGFKRSVSRFSNTIRYDPMHASVRKKVKQEKR